MKSLRGFAWIPVLIVLGLLAGGIAVGYGLYRYQYTSQEEWKKYTNEEYGISFNYPSSWIIQGAYDTSFTFVKNSTLENKNNQQFSAFYVNTLNANIRENGTPYYISPQEFFDSYYVSSFSYKAMQIGQIPVIKVISGSDRRYEIFTTNREISFVLYPDSSQYDSTDDATVEQIIKSMSFVGSSKSFVSINLPSSTQ
jgi:hypothetical protein